MEIVDFDHVFAKKEFLESMDCLASSATKSFDVSASDDTLQAAPIVVNYHNLAQISDKVAVIGDDIDISEFFDIQNAACDPDDAGRNSSDSSLTNAKTLQSSCPHTSSNSQNHHGFCIQPWETSLPYEFVGYNETRPPVHSEQPDEIRLWPFEHVISGILGHRSTSYDALMPMPNDTSVKKRPLEHDSPSQNSTSSTVSLGQPRKRNRLTVEQRVSARKVRAQGACLRCYVSKEKCSEGRPCEKCATLFNQAYGSKTLQWRACISSNLRDMNIFALGVSLSDIDSAPSNNREGFGLKLDVNTASALYKLVFEHGGSSFEFKSLYLEVLQHVYGHRAKEVHPFILSDLNPLHMLVQINVVLLGSPIVAPKILGYIRYLQTLRAVCGIVTFEHLGEAFRNSTRSTTTLNRRLALIVQGAILMDQIVEMKTSLPAAAVCISQGKLYEDMHDHLIQYISHCLRKLVKDVFGKDPMVSAMLRELNDRDVSGELFWTNLSRLMPRLSLWRPPKLRNFASVNWGSHSEDREIEELCIQMSAFRTPIACS